jgi:hypothetical protein
MPAFAAFAKGQVARSRVLRGSFMTRERVFASSGSDGGHAAHPPTIGRAGMGRKIKAPYYEMENSLLDTRVTVNGDGGRESAGNGSLESERFESDLEGGSQKVGSMTDGPESREPSAPIHYLKR